MPIEVMVAIRSLANGTSFPRALHAFLAMVAGAIAATAGIGEAGVVATDLGGSAIKAIASRRFVKTGSRVTAQSRPDDRWKYDKRGKSGDPGNQKVHRNLDLERWPRNGGIRRLGPGKNGKRQGTDILAESNRDAIENIGRHFQKSRKIRHRFDDITLRTRAFA